MDDLERGFHGDYLEEVSNNQFMSVRNSNLTYIIIIMRTYVHDVI